MIRDALLLGLDGSVQNENNKNDNSEFASDITSIKQVDNTSMRLIARGGHGSVFLKNNTNTVIKFANNICDRQSLDKEAQILKELKNLNCVVRIRESQDVENLALEYIDGFDLSEVENLLASSLLSKKIYIGEYLNTILYLNKELLKSIQSVSLAGFSHNDIKPSNVMYDKNTECLKLIDFGEASSIGSAYRSGHETYASPEGLSSMGSNNKFNADESVDSWSFAQILFKQASLMLDGTAEAYQFELGELQFGPREFQVFQLWRAAEKFVKDGNSDYCVLPKDKVDRGIKNHCGGYIESAIMNFEQYSVFKEFVNNSSDLINQLMKPKKHQRIILNDALKHKTFDSMNEHEARRTLKSLVRVQPDDINSDNYLS